MDFLTAVDDSIEINGVHYECDLSMATVFLYFELMRDDGLTEYEKVITAYQMLIKNPQLKAPIDHKAKTVIAVFNQKISDGDAKTTADVVTESRNFDFDQDNDRLVASFLQQYNVNIRSKDVLTSLRWRDFIALMQNLDKDTPFGQAVYFRSVKIKSGMSDDQKKYLRDMKKHYALRRSKGELTFEEMDMPHKVAYLAKKMREEAAKRGK